MLLKNLNAFLTWLHNDEKKKTKILLKEMKVFF